MPGPWCSRGRSRLHIQVDADLPAIAARVRPRYAQHLERSPERAYGLLYLLRQADQADLHALAPVSPSASVAHQSAYFEA